ncbi:Na+/H+ antiporter NhaA [Brevundimonas sp. CEF1]|uniref:Na+/H+ antiporter NhaA n=1 Tax=Brevundimonas sp. CEF1 TaxID=3442642 RepID=UPI003F519A86
MAHRLTLSFLKTEAASGTAMALAAVAAIVVANSPWSGDYFTWLKSYHVLQLGPIRLEETISDWIKEGLMAIFFLVVGLEIKYEIMRGELSNPKKLATPVLAALGGMAGPSAVYLLLSGAIGAPHQGWPIPLATDIAFALAIFSLIGRGLPSALRVFLLTLAIVDDLGAIALIAILFSEGTHWVPLMWALSLISMGGVVAHHVRIAAPFWVMGFAAVWYLTVLSGISTSLTAFAFAMMVPIKPRGDHQSPLREAIHDLHPWNAFLVLPLFAFAKAGISFAGLSIDQAFTPLVIAIALGLFFGKQIGVLGMAWVASALKIGARPTGASWLQVYGVSLLCGVGFTMSLFIGALTFPGAVDSPEQIEVKLGVIGGSILSAIAAAAVLGLASRKREVDPTAQGQEVELHEIGRA